jgi:hypothetical protein
VLLRCVIVAVMTLMTPPTMRYYAVVATTSVSSSSSTTSSSSFRRLLQNENDKTLLSRTALIDKAIELNHIVQDYHRRRKNRERALYTSDMFGNITTRATADDYTDTTTGTADDVYTEERVNEVCQLIQSSFLVPTTSSTTGNVTEPVTCKCMGTLHGTLSINCDYATSVCTEPTETTTTRSSTTTTDSTSTTATCGIPQLGVTMVRGYVFSATTCISQYRRGLIEIPDTCVFVNTCEDMTSNTFCDCTASHNGSICSTCTICDGGKSMSVDCTNINPTAISTTCQPIDIDLDINNGAGHILGFMPQFTTGDGSTTTNTSTSFCSQVESKLENQVSCDCSTIDGSSASYQIQCSTNEPKCDVNNVHCGIVTSSIQITDGQYNPNVMTTCTKYWDPMGETCTTIDYCNNTLFDMGTPDTTNTTNTDNTTETSQQAPVVCGCQVTYEGNVCNSCTVCNDGNGISFDCTNYNEFAYSEQCQIVSRASSFELVPLYATTAKPSSTNTTNTTTTTTMTPSTSPPIPNESNNNTITTNNNTTNNNNNTTNNNTTPTAANNTSDNINSPTNETNTVTTDNSNGTSSNSNNTAPNGTTAASRSGSRRIMTVSSWCFRTTWITATWMVMIMMTWK